MESILRISGTHYDQLLRHLYPGDGKEAVSIAICGRLELNKKTIFLIHKIFNIPYSECTIREELFIEWKTELLQPLLIEATKNRFSLLKIHSHPTGIESFSETDTQSDITLFNSIFGWVLDVDKHLSAIMLPDGTIKARTINTDFYFETISKITIIGDDIIFNNKANKQESSNVDLRNIQTFGKGTVNLLKTLSIAIIGCSGTGSIIVEQLARLGVGKLVLVDPDKIEEKNLNRIINSTREDALNSCYKVHVLERAISTFGFNNEIRTFNCNLFDSAEAIMSVASCDIIFGCVDSVDGRFILNLISTFYLVPLFDVGVRLDADGKGNIDSINGSSHYIQPGKSSLLNRGVYDLGQLESACLYRKNPEEFKERLKEKYIVNVQVDSPAVISVNMFYASMAVNDFLARVHLFRVTPNSNYAIQRFSLTDPHFYSENENEQIEDKYLEKFVGRGDTAPLLNLPELSSLKG